MDCEVWSVKCGLWSVKCEVWTVKCEVCSVKCEVWSVRFGVWGKQWEVRSVECEVWSVKCEVWSAKSAVCSVRCGVSMEGHGRDRVSLNYRSFMFGKLPPPACTGLCYMVILFSFNDFGEWIVVEDQQNGDMIFYQQKSEVKLVYVVHTWSIIVRSDHSVGWLPRLAGLPKQENMTETWWSWWMDDSRCLMMIVVVGHRSNGTYTPRR